MSTSPAFDTSNGNRSQLAIDDGSFTPIGPTIFTIDSREENLYRLFDFRDSFSLSLSLEFESVVQIEVRIREFDEVEWKFVGEGY